MARTPITVELDEALQARLVALARGRGQNVSDLVAEVIASYFSPESTEYKHIETGLEELEAGNGLADERVEQWLESWGTEDELSPPQ